MRKLTTTQWLFAGIAALLVILAGAILYGNAHRPSPFRPKERITVQAPKRSDLVEGLRVCTGLSISDVPTLKSQ